MEEKTLKIRRLAEHLTEKYGATNIIVTDYWDADNTAIGLTDKTRSYTVYIVDKRSTDNSFFVSLENPSSSYDFPYTPAGDFDNLSAAEVEEMLIKHLRIVK